MGGQTGDFSGMLVTGPLLKGRTVARMCGVDSQLLGTSFVYRSKNAFSSLIRSEVYKSYHSCVPWMTSLHFLLVKDNRGRWDGELSPFGVMGNVFISAE